MMSPDVAAWLEIADKYLSESKRASVYNSKVILNGTHDIVPDSFTKKDMLGMQLPFPNVAIVGRSVKYEYCFCLVQAKNIIQFDTCLRAEGRVYVLPQLLYDTTDGSGFIDKCPEELAKIVGTYAMCAGKVIHEISKRGGIIYTATPNPTNARRQSKGKRPLFTWTTVNLDAPRYISEPKGGTHASSRLHDRRGHWVTSKLGKRFWRKDTKVGSAKNGIAFQTYQKGIESDE